MSDESRILARVYSLVAEMEALKAEIEVLKRSFPEGVSSIGGGKYFQEKADQLRGISTELQQLGF